MNFIKLHNIPLFLITTSILLSILGEKASLFFMYDRSSIIYGELWRLISAHLVHLGWEHLFLNLAAFLFIWYLVKEYLSSSLWWLLLIVSSLSISLCLLMFNVELQWYVGLSGVLHSIIVVGAVIGASKGRKEFMLLSLLIAIKVSYEQFYGSINIDLINGNVIVDAHLYGVCIGLIYAMLFIGWERCRQTD